MTTVQRLELRRSEVSQELATLAADDNPDQAGLDRMKTLTAEVAVLEQRWQAATAAAQPPAPAASPADGREASDRRDKELTELRSRVSLTRFIQAGLEQRSANTAAYLRERGRVC